MSRKHWAGYTIRSRLLQNNTFPTELLPLQTLIGSFQAPFCTLWTKLVDKEKIVDYNIAKDRIVILDICTGAFYVTLNKAAARLSTYLAQQVDLPRKQLDTLRFGLEIIIGSVIKVILLFALVWASNIIMEVTVALLVGSGFRLLAGGAHATGYVRCLILGLTVYLTTGWVATTYASLLSPYLLLYLLLTGFLLSSFEVLRWAPGKIPGKKLTLSKHRQFRILSVLYLFPWLGAMIYLAGQGHSSLALAGLLALLLQGFSLTPIGYRLIGRYDLLLSKNQRREVVMDVGQV